MKIYFMKLKTFLPLTLLVTGTFSTPSAIAGTGDGGGADPIIINSVPYKNKEQLSKAIDIVRSSLSKSEYAPETMAKLGSRLEKLIANEGFQSIPDVIILTSGQWKGYKIPKEEHQFLTLGCFNKNDNVYCMERVLSYAPEKLAEIVVHETLHMELNSTFAQNEKLIVPLSESIVGNTYKPNLNLALTNGVFIDEHFVERDGILDALHFSCRVVVSPNHPDYTNLFQLRDLRDGLEYTLPENLATAKVKPLVKKFKSTCAFLSDSTELLEDAVLAFNPESPYLQKDEKGEPYLKLCKVNDPWYRSCPEQELVSFEELFFDKP